MPLQQQGEELAYVEDCRTSSGNPELFVCHILLTFHVKYCVDPSSLVSVSLLTHYNILIQDKKFDIY